MLTKKTIINSDHTTVEIQERKVSFLLLNLNYHTLRKKIGSLKEGNCLLFTHLTFVRSSLKFPTKKAKNAAGYKSLWCNFLSFDTSLHGVINVVKLPWREKCIGRGEISFRSFWSSICYVNICLKNMTLDQNAFKCFIQVSEHLLYFQFFKESNDTQMQMDYSYICNESLFLQI